MPVNIQDVPAAVPDIFRFTIDKSFNVTVHVSLVAAAIVLVLVGLGIVVLRLWSGGWLSSKFEIDQASLGLGDHTLTFRPNERDREVAYKIWVELSTRKIGLPIDIEDDVVAEVYDSWFTFFSVTRELIKDVPVSKLRRGSTRAIIQLSIEVLNSGLRPHLTRWQARFRRWYGRELDKDPNAELHPQDIQKKFPDFEELAKEMLAVNERLIAYRQKMYELMTEGDKEPRP